MAVLNERVKSFKFFSISTGITKRYNICKKHAFVMTYKSFVKFSEEENPIHIIPDVLFPNITTYNFGNDFEIKQNISGYLKKLLKIPAISFWNHLIFDENLISFINIYLERFPKPFQIIEDKGQAHSEIEQDIFKLVLLLCIRCTTYKELIEYYQHKDFDRSYAEKEAERLFKHILGSNSFLFNNGNTLINFINVYGETNHSLLSKAVKNMLLKVSTIKTTLINQIEQMINQTLVDATVSLSNVYEGNSSQPTPDGCWLENEFSFDLYYSSICLFHETIYSIHQANSLCCDILAPYLIDPNQGYHKNLAIMYETIYLPNKQFVKSTNILTSDQAKLCTIYLNYAGDLMIQTYQSILKQFLSTSIYHIHETENENAGLKRSITLTKLTFLCDLIETTLLSYPNWCNKLRESKWIHTFLIPYMADALKQSEENSSTSSKKGAQTSNKSLQQIETKAQELSQLKNDLLSICNQALTEQINSGNEMKITTPENAITNNKLLKINDYENDGPSTSNPSAIRTDPIEQINQASINTIIELFPNLTVDRAMAVLKYYDTNLDRALNALMDNNIPPNLEENSQAIPMDEHTQQKSHPQPPDSSFKPYFKYPQAPNAKLPNTKSNRAEECEGRELTKTFISKHNLWHGGEEYGISHDESLNSNAVNEDNHERNYLKTGDLPQNEWINKNPNHPDLEYEDEYDDTTYETGFTHGLSNLKNAKESSSSDEDTPTTKYSGASNNSLPTQSKISTNPMNQNKNYAYKEKHKHHIANHARKHKSDIKYSKGMF